MWAVLSCPGPAQGDHACLLLSPGDGQHALVPAQEPCVAVSLAQAPQISRFPLSHCLIPAPLQHPSHLCHTVLPLPPPGGRRHRAVPSQKPTWQQYWYFLAPWGGGNWCGLREPSNGISLCAARAPLAPARLRGALLKAPIRGVTGAPSTAALGTHRALTQLLQTPPAVPPSMTRN